MKGISIVIRFLAAIFHAFVVGNTFRKNMDVYFALSNSEMTLDEQKQRGNRLLLIEGEEKFVVFAQLVDKNNWSLARSEEITRKYLLSGLHPYITFRNKTWLKTYKFQSKVNSRWRFEVKQDVFEPG